MTIWLVDANGGATETDLPWNVPGSDGWDIKGTGDFNGDGYIDLLWYQGSTGVVGVWYMNGTAPIVPDFLDRGMLASTGAELMGTGDYNRDGNPDLVWYHNDTGKMEFWLMSGVGVFINPMNPVPVPPENGFRIVSR